MIIRNLIIWFVVVGFLPNNGKLIEPVQPEGTKAIQYKDLDGDGKEEVIATYKTTDKLPEVNVIILKRDNGKWVLMQKLKSLGYAVDRFVFEDIDNDGKEEVIFGSKLGGVWNHLNVYKSVNNKYNKVYNNIYSDLEIKSD